MISWDMVKQVMYITEDQSISMTFCIQYGNQKVIIYHRVLDRLRVHQWHTLYLRHSGAMGCKCLCKHNHKIHLASLYCPLATVIKGILPKGPYLPCVSMAGRALLAGYHRHIGVERPALSVELLQCKIVGHPSETYPNLKSSESLFIVYL